MLVALLSFVLGQPPPVEPQQDDWDWLSAHRMDAFEALMPLEGHDNALVTFRSYRSLYQDVREQYFRITEPTLGSLSATVVTPVGSSLQQQLLDLHINDRTASFQTVLARVQVTDVVLTERECPQIRSRIQALETMRFRTPTRELIILHPMIYWIFIDFGAGKMLNELQEGDHPLVVWAIDTRQELEKCVARATR